mgnify:FL=1
MKSFVYTVVAATIAASSAVAGSTDASTSGTVPTVQPYCQFSEITDGTMAFVPGWDQGFGHKGVGFWRTHHTNPATIRVQAAGASKVSVIGGNKVINKSDGTEYPVQVDYAGFTNMSTYYDLPEYIENFDRNGYGTGPTEMTGVGGHRDKEGLVKVIYRDQADPTWAPDRPHWGIHLSSGVNNAVTTNPDYPSSQFEYVHDQVDVEFHSSLEEVNFFMHIQGGAYMLDSNREMKYEDDGKGRRTAPVKNYPNGRRALSYYGMTDGDYYIQHTVQCLQ